ELSLADGRAFRVFSKGFVAPSRRELPKAITTVVSPPRTTPDTHPLRCQSVSSVGEFVTHSHIPNILSHNTSSEVADIGTLPYKWVY
ncbi:hypothetical protein J6590_033615, partial [Homalodisca vitripennis]